MTATPTIATDIAGLLDRTALFGGLPRSIQTAIAGAMRSETYSTGQTIFSRAEPASTLYLVTAGRVRLSVTSPEGRELTFRFAERGDIMGEIAALDEGARTADAVAATTVEAQALGAAQLSRLLDDHPDRVQFFQLRVQIGVRRLTQGGIEGGASGVLRKGRWIVLDLGG